MVGGKKKTVSEYLGRFDENGDLMPKEKDDGSDITDREIDYWFDDREGKRCRRSSGPGTAGLLPTL